MERTVNVTVNAAGGIAPATPQYAGIQGEHNACRVVFDVSAWAAERFLYRGEFVGGDGTGGTTDVLEQSEGCVSFALPAAWTAAGGRAVARLVASLTADGEETQTVFAVDVPLYFAAKQEYTEAVREEEYTGLTALAASVQEAVDEVEQKLADGSFIGPQGERGPKGERGSVIHHVKTNPVEGPYYVAGIVAEYRISYGSTTSGSGLDVWPGDIVWASADWYPVIQVEEEWVYLGKRLTIQGMTPYIGDNGDWWIGEEDTGVKARDSCLLVDYDHPDYILVKDTIVIATESRGAVFCKYYNHALLPLISWNVKEDGTCVAVFGGWCDNKIITCTWMGDELSTWGEWSKNTHEVDNVFIGTEKTPVEEYQTAFDSGKVCFLRMARDNDSVVYAVQLVKNGIVHLYRTAGSGLVEHGYLNALGLQNMVARSYVDDITEYTKGSSVPTVNAVKTAIEKPWELIESVTLEEDVSAYELTVPANTFKEVFVEGAWTISTEATSSSSQRFIIGQNGAIVNDRQVSVSNGTKVYYRAHGTLAPSGALLYDVAISTTKYTGGTLSRNAGDQKEAAFTHIPNLRVWIGSSTHFFGAGSTFKVWGR